MEFTGIVDNLLAAVIHKEHMGHEYDGSQKHSDQDLVVVNVVLSLKINFFFF